MTTPNRTLYACLLSLSMAAPACWSQVVAPAQDPAPAPASQKHPAPATNARIARAIAPAQQPGQKPTAEDRREKAMQTTSNVLKKTGDSANAAASNIK
ncbi:MAG: hypothetical protein ACJ8GW_06510 [Massilia sp.]